MRSDVRLDFAIFQLTPTRTRCELFVVLGKENEKLASGLLQPFLTHLKAAEEQLATGGYSIRLQPGPEFGDSESEDGPWFTKGTMERFVRFVSTPEILERVSTVSAELAGIEEDISNQATESSKVDISISKSSPATPPAACKDSVAFALEKPGTTPKSKRDSLDGGETPDAPDSSKRRLLRAIDARRLMLQKEQGMAFARAAAAGFDMPHITHLLVFADCFGATRLRDATMKYMALCKKRQEAGLWIEEMELGSVESAGPPRLLPVNLEGSFAKPKDQPADIWPQRDGFEYRGTEYGDESRSDGRGVMGEDSAERGLHRRSAAPRTGQASGYGLSPNGMDVEGDYRHQSYFSQNGTEDYYHDQQGAERSPAEDGAYYSNGSGSRWHPTSSPPSHKLPPSRYGGGGYSNESHHESGEWGPQSRRHWAINPPHNASAQYAPGAQFRGSGGTGPYLHEPDRDYHDSRMYQTSQSAQGVYYPDQAGSVDGNHGGQGMWSQSQNQAMDQPWQLNAGYSEGPRYGPSGDQDSYRRLSSTGYKNHMMLPSESGITLMGTTAQAHSGTDQAASDHDSISPPEQESQSPNRKNVRHLSTRSPSPKRRSSSPLRRVRPGARRSNMVVIRNINYITSKHGENGDKNASNEKESDEASESMEDTDVAMDEEDDGLKRSENLSVKDAISLFEVKRRESNDGSQKRRSKPGSRRGSSDSTTSSLSEKPVLRRWSTTGDLSRGSSSTMSKNDLVDETADSQKIDAAGSDFCPAEMDVPRDAYRLPKPSTVREEAFILPSRSTQPSHSSFDPNIEAPESYISKPSNMAESFRMPAKEPEEQTASQIVAPDAQTEPQNNQLQIQKDDSLIIPDRNRRTDVSSSQALSQENELMHTDMPKVSDDSFIVPSRGFKNEQTGSGWRSDVLLESEIPREQQTASSQVASASGDLFMLPDRRDSSGCNTAVDHSMENVVGSADNQKAVVTPVSKPGVDSPKDHKGRLYDQYREKRDAKLRGEQGSKKAERDAKLKAMQDVLEKRKAEMTTSRSSRLAEKHVPSLDAQLRAEKLRAFKADLARSKKEKDEEERKRLEEMRAQRRERIAARSSPSSGSPVTATPRASLRSSITKPILMQKLQSPQKSANVSIRGSLTSLSPVVPRTSSRPMQRRGSTVPGTPVGNPLSRSVPSFAEFRKENTRPPSLRSSMSFNKASSTIPRASTAPSESNGVRLARRAATVINDDKKKRQILGTRKSLSALCLDSSSGLEAASKLPTPELNGTFKTTRRLSVSAVANPPEVKPFLRKGKGQGPTTGPGTRKLKEASLQKDPQKNESPVCLPVHSQTKHPQEPPVAAVVCDDRGPGKPEMLLLQASTARANGGSPPSLSEMPETESSLLVTQVTGQHDERSIADQASDGPYDLHVQDHDSLSEPASTAYCFEKRLPEHEEDLVAPKSPDFASLSYSSPVKVPTVSLSSVQQYHVLPQQPVMMPDQQLQQAQSDSPGQDFTSPPHSPIQEPSPTHNAPLSTISDLRETLTAGASVSPSASPVSESYPVLQASLSPEAANANMGKSRKRWGSTQKVATGAVTISKEEPKGLRKLLNFGRKSRSSGTNLNEWVSTSTLESSRAPDATSDKESLQPTQTSEQRNKGVAHDQEKSLKSMKSTKNSKSALMMRESISKDVDVDIGVDERTTPASRSFFSLSSFRSKGSETRTRS